MGRLRSIEVGDSVRYLESVVSSGVQAHKEMKDLEERVTFIQNEKVALDKAKLDLTSKVERLKELVKTTDRLLEELKDHLKESEKAHFDLAKKDFKLKEEIKYMEGQWVKSATKIEQNFLA